MNIVQRTEFFLRYFHETLVERKKPMDELEDAAIFTSLLPDADFYEIPEDIFSFAQSLIPKRKDGLIHPEDLILDQDARTPSTTCAITIPSFETSLFLVHKTNRDAELYHIYVAMRIGQNEVESTRVGGYSMKPTSERGEHLFLDSGFSGGDREAEDAAATLVYAIAKCFSIINQPRFVIQSPAATRQQRKYMMRARKIAVDAWHKIEWNIAEPVYAPNETKQGGWNLPLHYKRGHWRKAEAHWDDVVIRKDGKPYKWIEGYWAGHPAYGIQKSYHAPKLGDSKCLAYS